MNEKTASISMADAGKTPASRMCRCLCSHNHIPSIKINCKEFVIKICDNCVAFLNKNARHTRDGRFIPHRGDCSNNFIYSDSFFSSTTTLEVSLAAGAGEAVCTRVSLQPLFFTSL